MLVPISHSFSSFSSPVAALIPLFSLVAVILAVSNVFMLENSQSLNAYCLPGSVLCAFISILSFHLLTAQSDEETKELIQGQIHGIRTWFGSQVFSKPVVCSLCYFAFTVLGCNIILGFY